VDHEGHGSPCGSSRWHSPKAYRRRMIPNKDWQVTGKEDLRFELAVAQLYRDLGAEVEHNKNLGGLQIDVYAVQRTADGSPIRTAVECKAEKRNIGVNDATPLCQRFNNLRTMGLIDIAVVVSKSGFTQDGRVHFEQNGVKCLTTDDLMGRIVDLTGYVKRLARGDKSSLDYREVLEKHAFIDLPAMTSSGKPVKSIVEYVMHWLDGPGHVLTILGKYGSGKSTTCKYLAQNLARQCCDEQSGRVPIFTELRMFPPNASLQSYLIGSLISEEGAQVRSRAVFERMNREGQFVLILDGFDEMTPHADPSTIMRNFTAITSMAQGNAKIIVTCRDTFLVDAENLDRLHRGTELHGLLKESRTYHYVFLQDFTEEHLFRYLQRYYGEDSSKFLSELSKQPELKQLAHHPILAKMIVSTVRSSTHLTNVNATLLYEMYTDVWIRRDEWRCYLTAAQRDHISKILAMKLLTGEARELHYTQILLPLGGYLQEIGAAERCEEEIRTCTFLTTEMDGYYRFVNLSFAEFFAAKYLLDCIVNGNIDPLDATWSPETLSFMNGLVNNHPDDYLRYIWDMINPRDVAETNMLHGRARAVAVYVLVQSGADLSGTNLPGLEFHPRARLPGAMLRGAVLARAQGTDLCLDNSDLSGAVMTESVLRNCSFRESALCEAHLEKSDLSRSDFSDADLRRADFTGANLEGAIVAPTDIVEYEEKRITALAVDRLVALSADSAFRALMAYIGEGPRMIRVNREKIALMKEASYAQRPWKRRRWQLYPTDPKTRLLLELSASAVRGSLARATAWTPQRSVYWLTVALKGFQSELVKGFEFSEAVCAALAAVLNSELSEIERRLDDSHAEDEEKREMERESRRLKKATTSLRQELRFHQESMGSIAADIRSFLQEIDACATKATTSSGPKVDGAVFSKCRGLSKSQKEWLGNHGAVFRIKASKVSRRLKRLR